MTNKLVSFVAVAALLLAVPFSSQAVASGSEGGWRKCGGTEGVFSVAYGSGKITAWAAYGSGRITAWAAYNFNYQSSSEPIYAYSPVHNASGSWSTSASGYYSYPWSWGDCA